MGQDILSILKPLDHFKVRGFHGAAQGIRLLLATFVDVNDEFCLRTEHYFGVILEIHLNDLVGEAEHDGVACAHPLLYVDHIFDFSFRQLIRADRGLALFGFLGSL
jgi:hypothetical protein